MEAGSASFTGLSGTPASFAGGSNKYLKVTSDGTGIEFVNLPAGGAGGNSSGISAFNKIQDNIDNVPLIGSGVQIPDTLL